MQTEVNSDYSTEQGFFRLRPKKQEAFVKMEKRTHSHGPLEVIPDGREYFEFISIFDFFEFLQDGYWAFLVGRISKSPKYEIDIFHEQRFKNPAPNRNTKSIGNCQNIDESQLASNTESIDNTENVDESLLALNTESTDNTDNVNESLLAPNTESTDNSEQIDQPQTSLNRREKKILPAFRIIIEFPSFKVKVFIRYFLQDFTIINDDSNGRIIKIRKANRTMKSEHLDNTPLKILTKLCTNFKYACPKTIRNHFLNDLNFHQRKNIQLNN